MVCIYLDDTLCIGDTESLKTFTKEIKKYFNNVEEGTLEEYVGCELRKLNKEELIMKQSNLLQKIKRNF